MSFKGKTVPIATVCSELGLSYNRVMGRIDRGTEPILAVATGKFRGKKLTIGDVRTIKLLLKLGTPGASIAQEFNITKATLCDIRKRRIWADIEPSEEFDE